MAEEKQYLVLTALGTDRSGIVAEVSQFLDERAANVEDSRMAVLGGEFALMMLVSGSAASITRTQKDIDTLQQSSGLHIHVKPTNAPFRHRAAGTIPYMARAYAMDREGIVSAITGALSRCGVNIVSLETSTYPAPMSGTPLFRMELHMDVPHAVPLGQLRAALTQVAEQENVDVELKPE